MSAFRLFLAEALRQRDLLWRAIERDAANPAGNLKWEKRTADSPVASAWMPRSRTERLLDLPGFRQRLPRLHRQALSEVPRDSIFPAIVAALDEMEAAHEAIASDAIDAVNEGRKSFSAEFFGRHCDAFNKAERLLTVVESALPPDDTVPFVDTVCGVLTRQGERIFRFVWEQPKKVGKFDAIAAVDGAFRGAVPSDDAIEKALKRIKTTLDRDHPEFALTLCISLAERRVKIESLTDK